MATAGVTMPQGLSLGDGHIHNIHEIGSPVKPKMQNITESQQFKRWFGDWQSNPKRASKVVDKEGKPLVVYHGTNAEFYVFRRGNKRLNELKYELEKLANTKKGLYVNAANYRGESFKVAIDELCTVA